MIACGFGRFDIALCLVENGTDMKILNYVCFVNMTCNCQCDKTPFMSAMDMLPKCGCERMADTWTDLLRSMIRHGAAVNAVNIVSSLFMIVVLKYCYACYFVVLVMLVILFIITNSTVTLCCIACVLPDG